MTEDEAIRLQGHLLAGWQARPEVRLPSGVARLQTMIRPLPRPGLTFGRIREENGSHRVEIRVTAARGTPMGDRAQAAAVRAVKDHPGQARMEFLTPPRIRRTAARAAAGTGIGMPPFNARLNPLHIGCSIAHERGAAGSIGAFVELADKTRGVLSCCHVLALSGRAKAGDPVFQPGWPDQQRAVASNRLGTLTKAFTPFLSAQDNNLDAAVASTDPDRPNLGTILPDLPCLPPALRGQPLTQVLPAGDLSLNEEVAKLGRTTGFRTGRVRAIGLENLPVVLEVPRPRRFVFSDIIEIVWDGPGEKAFSAGGDSGSLLFRMNSPRPAGLVFASLAPEETNDGLGRSYAIHLDRICGEFSLNLV